MEKDDDALPKKRLAGLEDGEDDSAKGWLANQLNGDASASVAISNGHLNAEAFRNETDRISSLVCHVPVSLQVI